MRTINTPKDPFNHYLEEVEKKENAQRRRLLVLVLGLFIGFGVLGAVFVSSFYQTQQREDYTPFEDLSSNKPEPLLAQQPSSPSLSAYHTEIEENNPTCIDSILCEVKGELKVDHPVYFHIANYDESNTYLMAYGEGSLRRIPSIHAFIFKNPGEYHIKITAIDPILNTHTYTIQKVFIQPNTAFLNASTEERRTHS